MFWLASDLIIPYQILAQDSGKKLIADGKKLWDEQEYEKAIKILSRAIQMELTDKADKIQAHEILARCYAVKQRKDLAQVQFLEVLKLKPDFLILDSESPIFKTPFDRAKTEFDNSDFASPEIKLKPIQQVIEGSATTFEATITDKSGVAWARIYYRTSGEAAFRVQEMKKNENDIYSLTLGANDVQLPALEYYIEAIDVINNPPALFGTKENPNVIKISSSDTTPPDIEFSIIEKSIEGNPLIFKAKINDKSGIANAIFYYRIQGNSNYKSLTMNKVRDDQYQVEIKGNFIQQPALEYFIETTDLKNNKAQKGTSSQPYVTIIVAADKSAPTIEHNPVTSIEENRPVEVIANIKDISGTKNAELHFKNSREASYAMLPMALIKNDTYMAVIPSKNVLSPELKYYISVYDSLGNGPALKGTENQPIIVAVSTVDKTAPEITHQPLVTKIKKGEAFIISTIVTDESGIAKVSLFYRHKGDLTYRKIEKLESDWRGRFFYKIPGYLTKEPGIEYYLQAYDNQGNGPSMMGTASKPILISVYTPDTIPPQISHTPIKKVKAGQVLNFTALINDNVKVKSAEIHYRLTNEKTYKNIDLKSIGDGNYKIQLLTNPKKSDVLYYFIVAYDESGNHSNWKTENNPYIIKIKKSSKTFLWLSLGTLVVGGAVLAVYMNDKPGTESTEPDLPGPPSFPNN